MGGVGPFRTSTATLGLQKFLYYCLTPLHHEGPLMVSLGGAIVEASRYRVSRICAPDRFVAEGTPVRRRRLYTRGHA